MEYDPTARDWVMLGSPIDIDPTDFQLTQTTKCFPENTDLRRSIGYVSGPERTTTRHGAMSCWY